MLSLGAACRNWAAVAIPGSWICAWSRPALLTAFPPLLCLHGLRTLCKNSAYKLYVNSIYTFENLLGCSLPFHLLQAHIQGPIAKSLTLPPRHDLHPQPRAVGSNVQMVSPKSWARDPVSSGFSVPEVIHVHSLQLIGWSTGYLMSTPRQTVIIHLGERLRWERLCLPADQ